MSEDRAPGRRPSVPDGAILAVFGAADEPVLSTAEVAEELPIGRRATLDRLTALAEDGRLERKSVGPRGLVWWLADDDTNDDGFAADPFLSAPTYASGRSGVSAAVDDALAEAIADETDADT